ncbi:MAG TPA: PHP domain-containing protein, partial [Chitinophagaceae bacterium]|nr:PHP domain-containing protein [Chitinophagaceae bacterium]
MNYSELHVTTNFSFLDGASHPEEFIEQATLFGYKEIAITDRNSFAGIVRAHMAASVKGIRLIPACRINILDGPALLAYPTNKRAYSQLSSLLTVGNLRTEKGECHLYKEDVYNYAKGVKLIVIPPAVLNSGFEFELTFKKALEEYKQILGDDLY